MTARPTVLLCDDSRALRMLAEGATREEVARETGAVAAVIDANLSIRRGEVFVVMGLSGSGKSTLVRMINRLLEPTTGRVVVGGTDITDLPPKELKKIPTVCGSLREALTALEADHEFLLAGGVFDKDQIDSYIELKMTEVVKFEQTPHPVEYEMYYSA